MTRQATAALPAVQRERAEEHRPTAAKADLRKPEISAKRRALGLALKRARLSLGWNLDELAHKCPQENGDPRDPRQVHRWETGAERAQWDLLFEVSELCEPLTVEIGRANGARVERRLYFGASWSA